MSNKKNNTTLNQKAQKGFNKFQNVANSIGQRDKYKERIKTSYICIIMYVFLLFIFFKQPLDIAQKIGILIAGACVCIFNIVKHSLSIKDDKFRIHNIILIIIQAICLISFILCFF